MKFTAASFGAKFREAKFYHCEKFQPLIASVCGAINSKLGFQAGLAGLLPNFNYPGRRKN